MPEAKSTDVLADAIGSSEVDRTTVLSALVRHGGNDVLSQHIRTAHRRATDMAAQTETAGGVASWESFI